MQGRKICSNPVRKRSRRFCIFRTNYLFKNRTLLVFFYYVVNKKLPQKRRNRSMLHKISCKKTTLEFIPCNKTVQRHGINACMTVNHAPVRPALRNNICWKNKAGISVSYMFLKKSLYRSQFNLFHKNSPSSLLEFNFFNFRNKIRH